MPNWCSTTYVAKGDPEQIGKLYDIMTELKAMPDPGLLPNDFGSTWLGNLVAKLDGDPSKIYCRGKWFEEDPTRIGETTLRFDTETAWGELDEVRHLIEEKFPKIKLYYKSEEPGMCDYYTNDKEGLFFANRYRVWIEDIGETEYFDTLEELCEYVQKATEMKNLTTYAQCEEAIEDYTEDHNGLGYELDEFEVLDD